MATRIRVLRGTKGRTTGWTVHCQEHGFIWTPTPTKKPAEEAAVEHARSEHQNDAIVETPAP